MARWRYAIWRAHVAALGLRREHPAHAELKAGVLGTHVLLLFLEEGP